MTKKLPQSTVLKSLDLFCGCGGMTQGMSWARGLHDESIQCVAAIDNWQPACDTFTQNHPIEAACQGVSRDAVVRILERVGNIDLVTGGPPCQGFSTSGKRALDDPRNGLVRCFLDAIEISQPRAFVMENVTGFTTFQNGMLMAEVVARARLMGFRVFPGIVLASLSGVPQRRRRFILVGLRSGNFSFPGSRPQTSDDYGLFGQEQSEPVLISQQVSDGIERWSFDSATSDLAILAAGETRNEYRHEPENEFQYWARNGQQFPTDHIAVSHNPRFVEMMSFIPSGASAMDKSVQANMPIGLRPKSGFPNSYARIRGAQPAPTITRNFTTPSSANCIHPTANRALSIREGARCQSFLDSFVFSGTLTDRRLQIGNAVPPLLAKAIGTQLLNAIFPSIDSKNKQPRLIDSTVPTPR